MLPVAFLRSLSASERALARRPSCSRCRCSARCWRCSRSSTATGDLVSDLAQAPAAAGGRRGQRFRTPRRRAPELRGADGGHRRGTARDHRDAGPARRRRRGGAAALGAGRLGSRPGGRRRAGARGDDRRRSTRAWRPAATRSRRRAAPARRESAALPAMPAAEAALAAAELITHAIDVGVADPALVPVLAARGARGLRDRGEPTPTLADAVAIGRTQLELGAMRPDTALAVIDAALPKARGGSAPDAARVSRGGAARLARAALGRAVGAGHLPRPPALAGAPRAAAADRAPAAGYARRFRPRAARYAVGPVQIPGAAATRKVRRAGR